MPRKTRVSLRKSKRKTTRKTSRRTRRMRGGVGVSSCPAGSVHILEDDLKMAGPDQIICYGDSLTSCITVTVIMENNWKVGAHMNTPTHYAHRQGNTTAPAQNINPETILLKLKEKLDTDRNFTGKRIKAVYVIGEPKVFKIYSIMDIMEGVRTGYESTMPYINNEKTAENRKNYNSILNNKGENTGVGITKNILNTDSAQGFFQTHFGDRFVDEPSFTIISDKEIQASRGQHFLIQADGTLDIS